jgi:RND family efflux transporter MFP subunit
VGNGLMPSAGRASRDPAKGFPNESTPHSQEHPRGVPENSSLHIAFQAGSIAERPAVADAGHFRLNQVAMQEPDQKALLKQLRIGHEQREDDDGSGRRWWIAVVVAVVVGGVAASIIYFARGPRVEVEIATAAAPSPQLGAAAILQATGYVTARREATVSAQITGTLTDVLIEEGEHVQAGQVLARLDDTAQKASLAQAQAQLSAAQALLVQSQAQLEQGRRDLKRNEDLVGQHLVSQQALETARTQVEIGAAQVESQKRQVQLARATVEGAQVQLGYTTIRAPFSGVIIAKAAQKGEIVSPISAGGGFTRTGVGTVVDMDSLEIEVDVNEAYLHRVHPDQPAQAVLDAYPDWTIPAHVIAIIPTADRSKATVKVRIALDQKDPRILPDMGVRVSFLDETAQNAQYGGTAPSPPAGVLVPGTAIAERAGKSVVFTTDGSRAHQVSVVPGADYGELRLVEGLASGAKVIRAPPANLNDGSRIVVKKQ